MPTPLPADSRTLLIHGEHDPLYPVELVVELYCAFPTAAFWVVPNGGHGPIYDDHAGPFVEAAEAFLAGG